MDSMGRREEGPHLITGCGAGFYSGGQYVSPYFVKRHGSSFWNAGPPPFVMPRDSLDGQLQSNHFFNPSSKRTFAARFGYGKKHYRKASRGTYSFSKASRKGSGSTHPLRVIGVTANSTHG